MSHRLNLFFFTLFLLVESGAQDVPSRKQVDVIDTHFLFSSLDTSNGMYLARFFDDTPEISEQGAYSVNKDWEEGRSEKYYIEQQRYGADFIEAGILLEEVELIDCGIKMINWGFARQVTDGGYLNSGDAVHSVSLFLEAAARASLALNLYDATLYKELLSEWRIQIESTGLWFLEHHREGRDSNLTPFAHRYFLRASALLSAYEVTKVHKFERASKRYMRQGLSLQQDDGGFLEKAGYDASYHMVGMAFMGRYYTLSRQEKLKSKVLAAFADGVECFLKDVSQTGEVFLEPDSRTVTELSREGVAKKFDFKHTSKALGFGAQVFERKELEEIAYKILLFYDKV